MDPLKWNRWKMLVPLLGALVIVMGVPGGFGSAFAEEWKRAVGPWQWVFPRDHGAHPDFRTEWWYFTGNLTDPSGKRFGYQLTFFRQAVALRANDPENVWSIRDLYLAHFTLTDGAAGEFWYAERLSRTGPGLAGAATDGMGVWLLNWSAHMEPHGQARGSIQTPKWGDIPAKTPRIPPRPRPWSPAAGMKGNRILLEARHSGMELSLELNPRKPLVFHGENGLSRKGSHEGQASYYFSHTDLATGGTIKTPLSQKAIIVDGTSWFDHEFGSNQLASNQVGWDWFSLHLSDGQDLMIYFLRRTDGSVEPTSSGTLIGPLGRARDLPLSEISLEVLDHWKSLKSGGKYPGRWRVRVPSARIDVVVAPVVAAQELITGGSTGVIYWEGAVEGKGKSGDNNITCEGYVELTGYAGGLGGLF